MKERHGKSRQPFWLALPLALLTLLLAAGSALAAGGVQDNGGMFSASARNAANQKIQQIQRETGKTIEVVTVASLGGRDINAEADRIFQQDRLNGVLLYMSKDDRKLAIKVGVDTRKSISIQQEASIRETILSSFKKNDFDGGLLAGIDRIGSDLRAGAATGRTGVAPQAQRSSSFSWFPILLIFGGGALVLWLLIRAYRRSQEQQAAMTPTPYSGYGTPPPPAPAGGGGWFGGGGGGFFSGLMGGLAGAVLGNALFDAFRGHRSEPYDQSSMYNPPADQGWNVDDAGRASDSSQDVGSWDDSGSADWGGDSGDSGGGTDW